MFGKIRGEQPGCRNMLCNYDKKKIAMWILLGGCVILASQPAFASYLYYGHDLQFHLNRIEGIKESLMAGIFPARMNYGVMGGAGYPVSVFYGDIFLYIPALLRILGCSVQLSYQIYIVMINLLTAIIMYCVLKDIFKDKWIGMIGTFIFLMAPYRLECVYLRAAVGEYTALAFYPLIIYALYKMYMEEEENNNYNWIYLAIGFCGLILSHVISTFCAFLLTAIFCIANFKKTFTKHRLVKLIKAIMLTLGICAGFLVPFADYMLSGIMKRDVTNSVSFTEQVLTLSQLMSVFPHGTGCSYPVQNETHSPLEMTYAIGGAGVVVLLLYLFCMFYLEKKKNKIEKLSNGVLGFAILNLWMTTGYFPWERLERLSSICEYIMYYIQYPWRFLGPAAVFISIIAASLVYRIKNLNDHSLYYGVVMSLVLLAYISGNYFMTDYMTLNKLRVIEENEIDRYNIGQGEYLPEGAIKDYGEVILTRGNIDIKNVERIKGIYYVECTNLTMEEQEIQFPIINYDNYRIKDVEKGTEFLITRGEECRIKITLPKEYHGRIAVEYCPPWYWRVSEVVSMATLLGMACVICKSRKRMGC